MLVLLLHVVLAVVHHRRLDEVTAETVIEGIQVEGIINHVMEDQRMVVVVVLIFWKGMKEKES